MTTTDGTERAALYAMIADRLLVVGLVTAGLVAIALGDREHAGMLLAGALGAVAPLGRRLPAAARVLPIGLGIGAAFALSGCVGVPIDAHHAHDAPSVAIVGVVVGFALGAVGALVLRAIVRPLFSPALARTLLGRITLAMGLGVALSACGGASGAMQAAGVAHTVGRVTCAVVARAASACEALGLSPDEPCPVPLEPIE